MSAPGPERTTGFLGFDLLSVSFQAAESKREQYRRYLEKSGVMDTIASALVALYEETVISSRPPISALDFIKLHLGGAGPEPADADTLRMELADLQQKNNLLMEENKELRNKYEVSPEEGAAE
ncbi:c-Myc-binding protein-like [Limanda limanda]|uniref:c-Myc-binding protein-like n=1 Tax=Limanda limanda TaxID=27771 RepID=UPI0029C6F5B5|nr:c-Myc-binding protein-like [Limanda limanda]